MSRSELIFWVVALAICAFAGVVIVITTQHRHGGYMTRSGKPYSASAVASMLG